MYVVVVVVCGTLITIVFGRDDEIRAPAASHDDDVPKLHFRLDSVFRSDFGYVVAMVLDDAQRRRQRQSRRRRRHVDNSTQPETERNGKKYAAPQRNVTRKKLRATGCERVKRLGEKKTYHEHRRELFIRVTYVQQHICCVRTNV